ncbi:MAG: amidohydrolase, partial [Acetobacteraceae bacterium]|nr:amidohydrolase [Acetobacteraceae bacterium]
GRLAVIDCDIHPAATAPAEIWQFLPERWLHLVRRYGPRTPQPFVGAIPYPRMTPGNGMRMDSWPPQGGPPASDLAFLRQQLLDPYAIDYGILQPLPPGSSTMDQELGAALCSATNEWQLAKWVRPEPRLKASLCITQDYPEAAVAEIERRAGDSGFVQVAITPRTIEPLGRRRYWPIYAAAERAGLPIGLHSAAYGPHANSPTGWFSYYIEEHYGFAHSLQTVVSSLVMEGVFERFPQLRVVIIEGGFAWVPPLAWRLDKHWARMRDEVPQLKRPPSDYVREHFWFTTQPIEEPECASDLVDTIRWIGADRLMFSTDYPHWDFDDPRFVFKVPLPEAERRAIFADNAKALYGLP